MDRIRIIGGVPLEGTIRISGAKNAALKLMAASLLTDQTLTLSNLPHLADISTLIHLLQEHGVSVSMNGAEGEDSHAGRILSLQAQNISNTTAPYDIVRKMRASILVLGPLVARCGTARVSLPGGCAIGPRPVDLHLHGLEALGADITLADGYVDASAPRGLKGATIRFPFVSVGATENLLMAATLAKGETVLENAAREPEIADLARCLQAMGAEIEGIGTGRLVIQGKPSLGGAEYRVMPDRIETGTYAVAAGITGGKLNLVDVDPATLGAVVEVLEDAGLVFETSEADGRPMLTVSRPGAIHGTDVTTQPYPGFPTDMQAQIMALMSVAEGASTIHETIFENRFMHVPELTRMGADIAVSGSTAVVRGVAGLKGAPVMATDLRASVSLVLAGLVAEGETLISRVYHLDRGYERIEDKLGACGARIERLKG